MASLSLREFGKGKSAAQKENQSRNIKTLAVGVTADGNNETKAPRAKQRKVLSSISNNVSANVRKQPTRAAKFDGRLDENATIPAKVFNGKPRNQPFSIYVDDDISTTLTRPQSTSSRAGLDYRYRDDIENHAGTLEDAVDYLPSIPSTSHHMGVSDGACFLDMSGVEEDGEEIVEDEENEDESDEHNVSMTALDQPMVCVTRKQRIMSKAEREAVIVDVPDYSADIYSYLLSVEHKNRPRSGFMKRQDDVTLAMRSILVDWLVEVAEEYKLHRETLFLTVAYIDRFLAQMAVLRSKLQLVGAAAMFLAAKYEEIYPPDVSEFVYITDDTYQKKQVCLLREEK